MTNDEAKAIGLRAVAWKDWREMPGMLLRHREYDNFRLRIGDERETPGTLGDVGPLSRAGWTVGSDGEPTGALLTWAHLWPDFRDPATLGCLLALVREVYGRDASATLHVFADEFSPPCGDEVERWWVSHGGGMHICEQAATEAEALVSALEAA